MPTYSYACDACGQSFEKEQRISEEALKKCELCGKLKARRQIVSGNFILKGGGWYSDGYGSSSSKSSSSASSSSATSSEGGKSETKTETKPDSGNKTETKPDKPAPTKAAAAE